MDLSEQNGTENGFRWSEKAHRAAWLVAEDDLSDVEIAAAVGIGRTTLHRWKQHQAFKAQVGDNAGDLNRAMMRLAIAKKRKRLATLDDLHKRAYAVIEQRASRYGSDADTPEEAARRIFQGGHTPPEASTGIMVREETLTAGGGVTVKWSFDAALYRELRALEEQAAKELGQWVEKSEIGGTVQMVRIVGADVASI